MEEAAALIDDIDVIVNDAAFGRWVPKDLHDEWHQGAGGGEFNRFWDSFIESEKSLVDESSYTVGKILDKLENARRIYNLD